MQDPTSAPATERRTHLNETLHHVERMAELDARRDGKNLLQSARAMAAALLVSVLMGAAAWAFLAALDLAGAVRDSAPAVFLGLPAVGVATAWVYRTHGLRSSRGNNLVIESAQEGTPIHARMGVLTFVCSTATHLVGGSAGREGAAVQIGGTIASNVSGLLRLRGHDRRVVMLAGISSAFGAVFGTPLAGAFFGMEMCTVGKLDYGAVLYCLAASFAGNATAHLLGTVHTAYDLGTLPDASPRLLIAVGIASIAFGLAARLFALAIRSVKRFWSSRVRNYLVAALVAALAVLAAYAVLGTWRYAGLSTWLIGAGFAGDATIADVAAKMVMTALTLGAGFQGGEVTPLFGMGAALGGWLGGVFGVSPALLAGLGMCCMFGAALNVPVTTVMLSIDLFGGAAAPYFVPAIFIAYLVAGHRGIYPAQRIVTPKRRSLADDAGGTVEAALARHSETE